MKFPQAHFTIIYNPSLNFYKGNDTFSFSIALDGISLASGEYIVLSHEKKEYFSPDNPESIYFPHVIADIVTKFSIYLPVTPDWFQIHFSNPLSHQQKDITKLLIAQQNHLTKHCIEIRTPTTHQPI